jgi:hypothetical protein
MAVALRIEDEELRYLRVKGDVRYCRAQPLGKFRLVAVAYVGSMGMEGSIAG